ncbi:MAG: histidine phosphatase family protein [Bacilli bacterium]
MRICFIRHGETNWNSQSLIQGIIDNPLNDNGIKQAENLALELLKTQIKWDVVFSSPLARAFDTAKIVSKKINYHSNIIIDNNVIERDFGKIEGMKLSEQVYNLIISEKEPSLEKVVSLKERVMDFIQKTYQKYPNKNILVFTHSHIIKTIKNILNPNYSFRSSLSNCAILQIKYDGLKIKEL